MNEHISVVKNNKWLKVKRVTTFVHSCMSSSDNVSSMCACLNRKCGSDAGWGWLIKHFIITNNVMTSRGEEKEEEVGHAFHAALERKPSWLLLTD